MTSLVVVPKLAQIYIKMHVFADSLFLKKKSDRKGLKQNYLRAVSDVLISFTINKKLLKENQNPEWRGLYLNLLKSN